MLFARYLTYEIRMGTLIPISDSDDTLWNELHIFIWWALGWTIKYKLNINLNINIKLLKYKLKYKLIREITEKIVRVLMSTYSSEDCLLSWRIEFIQKIMYNSTVIIVDG